MEAKKCPKLDDCYKIKMVLDKELAGDWQYAEAIKAVCDKCPGPEKQAVSLG